MPRGRGLSYLADALGMISYADLFKEEKDLVVWLLLLLLICNKPRSSSLDLRFHYQGLIE